ncbi:dTDP-4-dehydrorhamnose reductase [Brevundimonas balnearis]|uniref:dTDP-4-dehydrorhamnose reductase n=1 Tax=Brevundimonas balnearis TaxID=1572858 RepID=A0ABV6QYI6_9CAUL
MAESRDILVTGAAGQVGLALTRLAWPEPFRLVAPTRAELDLSDASGVRRFLEGRAFAAVINPAAYTAVDKAESEPAQAFAVNATAPALLAEACRAADVPLVHVSTDYVFDGAADRPYREEDAVGPLGVYGASKLAGELAVRSIQPRSVILRTAWVVGPDRSNFLKTMLRLAETRDTLNVVADQRGCPTAAADIAAALRTVTLRMIAEPEAPSGVFHFAGAGETTWAEFAEAIFAASAEQGGPSAEVRPITTAEYPTPARRPANSRLDCGRILHAYGIEPRDWRAATAEITAEVLRDVLKEGETR